MSFTKIFGWILLIIGLLIIGWALMSSYNIFIGKTAAPEIFKTETKETETITQGRVPATPEALQKEMEKIVGDQLKEILPQDALPKLLNLAAWIMLVFVFIFGGSKISLLGIKLITIESKNS